MKQFYKRFKHSLLNIHACFFNILPAGFFLSNDPAATSPWYFSTLALWVYLALAILLSATLIIHHFRKKRKRRLASIQEGTDLETVKEIKSALKQAIRSSEHPEVWYTKQLRHQQKKFQQKRKRKKRKKKVAEAAESNGKVVLINHFKKPEEVNNVYDGFIHLKKFYEKQQQLEKALRMLEMATVYKKLPPKLRDWALKTAARQGVYRGHWVGEAALDFANGQENEHSLILLQNAADKGDELSQMILNNRQYSEEMK